MFWLFWQLVGIAIALIGIGAVIALFVGGFALLIRMFSYSSAPHSVPRNTLPAGWASATCDRCGNQYGGVNEFEARKTLNWHLWTKHGIPVPTPLAPDGTLSVVYLGQIVEEKPAPGRRIYFAKCRICNARFESLVADQARSMRQSHMKMLHGLSEAARPAARM
jgi:hypothetical protein